VGVDLWGFCERKKEEIAVWPQLFIFLTYTKKEKIRTQGQTNRTRFKKFAWGHKKLVWRWSRPVGK